MYEEVLGVFQLIKTSYSRKYDFVFAYSTLFCLDEWTSREGDIVNAIEGSSGDAHLLCAPLKISREEENPAVELDI